MDNLKTRMQNQSVNAELNRMNYRNVRDCLLKAINVEGFNALFVGMYPYYIKTLLYATTTIYYTDTLMSSMKRRAGLEEWKI